MKIPNRIREEAALLCSMRASSFRTPGTEDYLSMDAIAHLVGASKPALSLAWEAMYAAPSLDGPWHLNTEWAEAEALLRTGWTP